jgi:hypothetical protein
MTESGKSIVDSYNISMTTIPARLARISRTSGSPTYARQRALQLYRDWYRSVRPLPSNRHPTDSDLFNSRPLKSFLSMPSMSLRHKFGKPFVRDSKRTVMLRILVS